MRPMTVLPIVKGEDTRVLRTKAAAIPKVTKEIKKLIKDMKDTVRKAEGLGIAGPQVGVSKAVCLAMFNGRMTAMINPEILSCSEETSVMEEGCLSLPGIDVNVERPVEVTVRYLDEKGSVQERHLHDLDARVVQHEYDHLNGVLILDHTPPKNQ